MTKLTLILFFVVCFLGCGRESAPDTNINTVYPAFFLLSDGSGVYEVFSQIRLADGTETEEELRSADFIPDNFYQEDSTNRISIWVSVDNLLTDIYFEDNLFDALGGLSDKPKKLAASYPELLLSSIQLMPEEYRRSFSTEFFMYEMLIADFDDDISSHRFYFNIFLPSWFEGNKDNFVVLPSDFSLINMDGAGTYSRSRDDILVEWDVLDADSEIEILINSRCLASNGEELQYFTADNDTGHFVLAAGTLSGPETDELCTTTIRVSKRRAGQISSDFLGGEIFAYQYRELQITTTN